VIWERGVFLKKSFRNTCQAGNDCAILNTLEGYIVVTTDPVPPPAARGIGGDDDLFWMGWLLVTINASDVAASGSAPQAFVAALEMPASLPVCEFRPNPAADSDLMPATVPI
jgi:thiamine monophosphate kinase